MQDKTLNYTKKRLALMFTAIVFVMIFAVEVIFLTSKYYWLKNIQISEFNTNSASYLQKNSRMPMRMHMPFKNRFMNTSHVNFLILSSDLKIIETNINWWIDKEFLNEFDKINVYDRAIIKSWYVIKKLKSKNSTNKLIFFQGLKYPLEDYIFDLLSVLIFTIILSGIFYYIWLLFISKNLNFRT